MSNVIKVKFRKPKRLSSLMGLTLDGSRLDGVVLRRVNGSLQVQQTFSFALTLDPLTAAPELVGREIRNQLDAAGVKERNCVTAIPLKWILTASTEMPQLAEADAAGLLQMEAERSFHSDTDTLQIDYSRCTLASGKQYVTLAGASKVQLTAWEKVLVAAKLKPVSFSSGISALQAPDAKDAVGTLALEIGETTLGMQLTVAGGIAALRVLNGAIENENGRRTLQTEVVLREIRITLGQLPDEIRQAVKQIRIFGPRELARPLADDLELRFEAAGLQAEVVQAYAANEFGVQLPATAAVSGGFSLAARILTEQKPVFEFLPPKPKAWEQLFSRYSSGKLRQIGMVVAIILLLVLGVFVFQQVQYSLLKSRWSKMSAQVTELNGLQQQIQEYRPWYDETYSELGILRELSVAFPEDGAVTAKSVEIQDGNVVTCVGTAHDQGSFLRMVNQLGSSSNVRELKVEQERGKTPMLFTFNFKWVKGGTP
jgi:hypothetical protein